MFNQLYQNYKAILDINKLEKAIVIYDNTTDTLHINIEDKEADEVILLENSIIVRIKDGIVIGLSIQGVSRSSS